MIERTIKNGSFLNCCMSSGVKRTLFEANADSYDINYRLDIPWQEVVSPMRKAYIKQKAFDWVPDSCNKFVYPLGTDRIEDSCFSMQATVLKMTASFNIKVPYVGLYSFKVYTCSFLTIYINGEKLLTSEEGQRNEERSLCFDANFKEGANTITIVMNDFSERDTQFYFKLEYAGKEPLTQVLDIEVNEEKITRVRDFLNAIYPASFNYTSKADMAICFGLAAPYPIKAIIRGCIVDSHTPLIINQEEVTIEPREKTLKVGHLFFEDNGLSVIDIEADVDGIKINKRLEAELCTLDFQPEAEGSQAKRKIQALEFLSSQARPNFQKILCQITTGQEVPSEIFSTEMEKIEKMYDCSDFRLPAVIWAYQRFLNHFSDEQQKRMKQIILNYRYWFDESGKDVMWFFSENHALCFHVCELLAGEMFENEVFNNSLLTGAMHKQKAKALLKEWFEHFFEFGYTEWNSSVYIPIDLIGFFALFELAKDAEVVSWAKKALDITFAIFARNSFQGVMASSFGRSYFKNLVGRKTSEVSALNFIAFGEGFLNQHCFSTTFYALSEYEVPEHTQKEYFSKASSVFNEYSGTDNAHLYCYKTEDFILASALNDKKGFFGHQEHMMQLMVGDCDTQVWINHPGEMEFFGSGRPSYFAGNGSMPIIRQDKGEMSIEFDIPAFMEVGFTHAFVTLSRFDEVSLKDKVLLLKKGWVLVRIEADNGLELTTSGPLKGFEITSPGRQNCWHLSVMEEKQ